MIPAGDKLLLQDLSEELGKQKISHLDKPPRLIPQKKIGKQEKKTKIFPLSCLGNSTYFTATAFLKYILEIKMPPSSSLPAKLSTALVTCTREYPSDSNSIMRAAIIASLEAIF